MLRGEGNWRTRLVRHLPLACAGMVAACAELSTHALADIIRFTPTLFIEQVFTDNVRGSATDRDADGITSLGARLNMAVQSSRIEAAATATVYYNEFWAADEFDDANGQGVAGGRLTLLRNNLFIDAVASRQEIFLTPESTTNSGLSTGGSQTKQTNYSVGPLLTAELFGLADLAVRATYSRVLFDEPQTGPLLTPIDDITAKQLGARVTTGKRASLYEAIGTAEHLETDTGFELQNAVGHLIVNVTASLSAIGRYGYERIEDPDFPLISGPRWSVGGRYTFGQNSAIHVEYGHRFDSVSWLGELELQLSPRVRIAGQYSDRLAPAQLASLRPIDDLFDDSGNLDLGSPPSRVTPDPALVNQTVRDKDLVVSATYTHGLATYALTGRHADRATPTLSISDKIYSIDFEWSERLSRSLTGSASVGFFDNYEPAVGSLAAQQYRAEVGFIYLLNPSVELTGAYLWNFDARTDEPNSQENILRFGVARTF